MKESMKSPQLSDDRLMLLYRLSQDLNASLSPDEVLERTMDDVVAVTRAERAFVMLIGDTAAGQEYVLPVTRGIKQETLEASEFTYPRSVVKRVMESGEAILTSDAQTDERFSANASVTLHKLRSILCVPLKSKSKLLGAIYVDNRIQHGVFTDTDLELLSSIAASAGTAMENARLYMETEARLRTLDLLHRISQEITATLDLDRVLTATTQAVKDLLDATAASILTVDGDELTFQVSVGGPTAVAAKPFRLPLGQGIAGWVVEHKQPVLVNDAQNDPRFFGTMDKKTGFLTEALIAVPLVVNERAIGVIEVFNKPGGFTHSDVDLIATFASSAAFAIENARLYQVAVDKGRLERELQVARQVQASLLPQHTPQFSGWDLAACWLPAREVAGDYYDFISLEPGADNARRLGLVIADVADKGMPAALLMVDVRATLRASMYAAPTPAHGIAHTNALVCDDAQDGMFVTLFYAQINAENNEVTYVNGGHNPPFWIKAGGDRPEVLSRTGVALGVEPSLQYTQKTIALAKGDFLVFYTDGVTDALNAAGQEFGLERLEQTILANRKKNAGEIVRALEKKLKSFTSAGGVVTDPFDDITLLVLKRVG
jgi:sigma-B regulation protein RsbU (phosphoserine phosphatase)